MAITPPGWISSTIWSLFLGGGVFCGVGSGSCTSIAFRDNGIMIMKMINNTRSTSIIGVTLGSFWRPPRPPVDIAMLRPSLFGLERIVTCDNGLGTRRLLRDHAGDTHAVVRRNVDRRQNLSIVKILVRLEVHDLVLSAGGH